MIQVLSVPYLTLTKTVTSSLLRQDKLPAPTPTSYPSAKSIYLDTKYGFSLFKTKYE